ncbi:MAG TPA: hypothetical protein VFP47_05860, partial [Pyrinomonadaceae bacterium]|nr:hypothetical protein [Pyrinomonadaceae bacterium]
QKPKRRILSYLSVSTKLPGHVTKRYVDFFDTTTDTLPPPARLHGTAGSFRLACISHQEELQRLIPLSAAQHLSHDIVCGPRQRSQRPE